MRQNRFHVVHPKAYAQARVKIAQPLQPSVVMASLLLPIVFLVHIFQLRSVRRQPQLRDIQSSVLLNSTSSQKVYPLL